MNPNYHHFFEYLPKRYPAQTEQESIRQLVYSFKNGMISDTTKKLFLEKIQKIATNPSKWIVCFIPASSSARTLTRYLSLSDFLKKECAADVHMDAIYNAYDKEIGHLNGKNGDPTDGFAFNIDKIRDKNIILIDDIITRGRSFKQTSNKLLDRGALAVVGLFLAKTINPECTESHDMDNNIYIDDNEWDSDYNVFEVYQEEETYDEYNGSYAQDSEGWSDQDIDDAFDGNPDAYWNID